ncbi:hypothetical protein DMUE_1405 [Dictyocoela muelleri]|nr:hypothetical protein DMUE_1405 [Dictyocoela muelleri]
MLKISQLPLCNLGFLKSSKSDLVFFLLNMTIKIVKIIDKRENIIIFFHYDLNKSLYQSVDNFSFYLILGYDRCNGIIIYSRLSRIQFSQLEICDNIYIENSTICMKYSFISPSRSKWSSEGKADIICFI